MMNAGKGTVGWRSQANEFADGAGEPSYGQFQDGSAQSSVPPWMVTFSDMMALLLTFFIMVASFSELKSEEKYQALTDVFQDQFGHRNSQAKLLPGQLRPRSAPLAKMASASRLKRMPTVASRTSGTKPARVGS